MFATMSNTFDPEKFRARLAHEMEARGMNPAALSKAANMNARAVKDILEGRSQSPKISTALTLAEALGVDPGVLIGIGPRRQIQSDLADYLEKYTEEDQQRFLEALRALPLARPE